MNRLMLPLALTLCLTAPLFAQKYEGLAKTPPMGWNSWNTFQGNINETLIREMADAIDASGMRAAGYEYIVLDDCWSAKERDADGNLIAHPERFKSGMKALGYYLHEKGFKFGIYNCAGTKTCAGYPGGHGHEEQDARTYASWGVDYLKYDWCNTEGADPKERYSKMRDALHAAGRPIVFSMCEWGTAKPWTWAKDVGHLWRTTGDISDCWDCRKRWSMGVKHILDLQAGLDSFAGPGHWNDPDMLEVGNPGLTYEESKAHFSLWCILAAPLMAGNDVRKMAPEIRDLLTDRDVIAIDQDSLGKQGYRVWQGRGYEIWVRELAGGDRAVCVLNAEEKPSEIWFQWNTVDSVNDRRYNICDVWAKKDLGNTDTEFRRVIEPHNVALLRLTPDNKSDK